ncbi:MAG: C25 family cysteine peptidase, partial [bacterium]
MLKRIVFVGISLLITLSFAREIGAHYLIIAHDDYYDILKPLAQWKTQKGIKAKIVKTSDIGSDSTQIRNFIVSAYNTWQIRPEYMLLVGNDDQVPFPRMVQHTWICNSDNYYTNVTGDFHNEIIPGRFWVNDTDEVKTVVAKVLGYERIPFLEDSLWHRKGVTIVNEDMFPPYSDSVYWADARYMHKLMVDAGFVHIDSFAESFGQDTVDL